ncbi:hypothetical protein [Psychroserpens ponticola]|uniref:Lipoprotein n=1 Tax=Psychroserpens ponticola TaxID=2932268 RepID=A0ABY7RU19_9FLAO|nr:hypothetical protein [Psychroserpens ponticola]WCO00231.1 hypothetical protein MUN68_009100 [Psychroserpens ponticola]
MKQSLLTILLFLLLNSCGFGNKGIDVSIENNTEYTLYNVSVSASPVCIVKFDSISSNQIVTKYLDMNEIQRTDGSYTIKFTYPDGNLMNESFGYYTNGWPNNYLICCSISEMSTFTRFDSYCK